MNRIARILIIAPLGLVATPLAYAQDGKAAFGACVVCHSVGTQGNKVEGPNLKGVVGGKVAAQPGYKYSDAMKKFAEANPVWTEALLDQYVRNAEELIPGTAMNNSPAVRSAATRKTIIDYLRAAN
jgi:cytochrome c